MTIESAADFAGCEGSQIVLLFLRRYDFRSLRSAVCGNSTRRSAASKIRRIGVCSLAVGPERLC